MIEKEDAEELVNKILGSEEEIERVNIINELLETEEDNTVEFAIESDNVNFLKVMQIRSETKKK